MKKILTILLAVMLIASVAIPAHAVTPDLGVPDVPEIPDISDDVHIELPDGIFDDYIPDIDIDVDIDVEIPTEPEPDHPAEKPGCPDWHAIAKRWISWWIDAIKNHYGKELPGMCK